MPRFVAPVRRSLKFPGVGGLRPSNPTLSDVMSALNQVQQNQAQILSAIDALQQSVNALMSDQNRAALPGGTGNVW